MYQRILVATDGSDLSRSAVTNAIELASVMRAELVALYVVPRYPVSYFEGGMTIPVEDIARAEKQWSDKGYAVVEAVQVEAKAQGVTALPLVVQSDLVAESIISAAKKHGCDLVVMASHGRRGIQRILLGSETQHVLTHCTVPVLVLR